jgi:5'-AMP-activated protein kinase regulatory gamma subunit
LQRNIRALGNEELEMHPISAWKEAKLQFYGGPDGVAIQRRPLVHVSSIYLLDFCTLFVV